MRKVSSLWFYRGRESLVATGNVQQLGPDLSWLALGRRVVAERVREGEKDHALKFGKQPDVAEYIGTQDSVERMPLIAGDKCADIVLY